MGLIDGLISLYNDWAIQIVVILSLAAHVVLTLLASVRRHQGLGILTVLVWGAYQVADWATPYALSKLFLRTPTREQQLVALWVPFLLTHLAGPDNIAAYSLEDSKLSARKVLSTILQVLGTSFAIYKQLYVGGDRALFWASIFMLVVGAAKCGLKAWVLWAVDIGEIRKASKDHQPKCIKLNNIQGHGGKLLDDKALLVAHQLLHITKGAFADFSVRCRSDLRKATEQLFHGGCENTGWDNMCKVVEMEISLMYDILYTKAAVLHTWCGYFICLVSPMATATVAFLFWLYRKDGHREADVRITYSLVVVTFILDVRWLLRAAASTWAYAFFNARPDCYWLYHHVFCSGKWHRLRRVVVSLDPRQLLFREPRGRYRLWSGTIGSYNLFDDCTDQYTPNPLSKLVKKFASEDTWIEYEYSTWKSFQLGKLGACSASQKIRKLLFDQIRETLKTAYPRYKPEPSGYLKKPAADAPKCPSFSVMDDDLLSNKEAIRERRNLDDALGFVPEFQEAILILHVATDVFFLCSNHQLLTQEHEEYKKVIQVVSNYMAFLAAARPDMLPGLKLRSLYSVTRHTLVWIRKQMENQHARSSTKDKLACFLRKMEDESDNKGKYRSTLYKKSGILSDGIKLAEVLLEMMTQEFCGNLEDIMNILNMKDYENSNSKSKVRIMFFFQDLLQEDLLEKTPHKFSCYMEMLKLVLKMWVRVLIFVSTRCARDSHAKQLARGCELTTIVWILVDHSSIFRI